MNRRWDIVLRNMFDPPQDITLQELRVECFFPADRETEKEAARFRASSRR
jgi:hypothetical protein